ncbi:hypothetical protein [Nonomuraea bangladeshensis]|uniref:hypothetical protein n=1 Tax=Nonomuraea bangladeshensis TaxID=404385 RepID=UPI0031CF0C2B
MAAWLVTEDPQQLIRVDSIVHVYPLPVFAEGDPVANEVPPRQRLEASHHVQIIVSTSAGQQVRALSCPGWAAWEATAQLIVLLAELARKHDAGSPPVFVYGPRGSRAHWNGKLWAVEPRIPEPDWMPSW